MVIPEQRGGFESLTVAHIAMTLRKQVLGLRPEKPRQLLDGATLGLARFPDGLRPAIPRQSGE